MLAVAIAAVAATPRDAVAQSPGRLYVGGFLIAGGMDFAASQSFDAVTGDHRAPIVGGGASIGLPWGGLFVEAGAWRASEAGERVLVLGGQVYPLGIPVDITVTPFELTGGWQFRTLSRRVMPYVGAGLTSLSYKETSQFAATGEDVDERYSGWHVLGGATVKLASWLGVGGEIAWTRIPDALGQGGVSEAFGETDLGGTSLRFKVTVGR